MHMAEQCAFLAVFEPEAFDGTGKAGRDDVVRAYTEAAKALTAKKAGVGIHRVPEY